MKAVPSASTMPRRSPATSAPGIDPNPPMTMISKPLTVVTTPLVGKTKKTGAKSAPATAASATPMPNATWSRRKMSIPAVSTPTRLCEAARKARPIQVRLRTT
jgi:hypothetical protein